MIRSDVPLCGLANAYPMIRVRWLDTLYSNKTSLMSLYRRDSVFSWYENRSSEVFDVCNRLSCSQNKSLKNLLFLMWFSKSSLLALTPSRIDNIKALNSPTTWLTYHHSSILGHLFLTILDFFSLPSRFSSQQLSHILELFNPNLFISNLCKCSAAAL